MRVQIQYDFAGGYVFQHIFFQCQRFMRVLGFADISIGLFDHMGSFDEIFRTAKDVNIISYFILFYRLKYVIIHNVC